NTSIYLNCKIYAPGIKPSVLYPRRLIYRNKTAVYRENTGHCLIAIAASPYSVYLWSYTSEGSILFRSAILLNNNIMNKQRQPANQHTSTGRMWAGIIIVGIGAILLAGKLGLDWIFPHWV